MLFAESLWRRFKFSIGFEMSFLYYPIGFSLILLGQIKLDMFLELNATHYIL